MANGVLDSARDDAHRRALRINKLERLVELPSTEDSVHGMALQARRELLDSSTRRTPSEVLLDASLLVRPVRGAAVPWDKGKGRDKLGPVPGLRAVGGTRTPALQVLLLAVLEAQSRLRSRSDGRTTIAVDPENGAVSELSWVRLVAVPPTDSPQRWRGAYQRENRLRQIKKALERLESLGRVSLGPAGHAGRHERFALLREYEDGSERSPYRVPPTSRALSVPTELWINGWLHVLTDAELLLYLALLHQADSDPEPFEALRVLRRDTRDTYNISKDNYEDLWQLAFFGLIRLVSDEDRNPLDGTMRGFKSQGNGLYHRIAVTADGLKSDAGSTVLNALRYRDQLI